MSTVFCDNCGTSLLDENAKFCRACGKPTPLSEAATKRFDEQPGVQSPTRSVGPSLTSPAYMAPFELHPGVSPAVPTNDLREKTRRRNIIIIASMLGVLILALGGLLIFLNLGLGSPAEMPPPPFRPPSVEVPNAPPPPPPAPPVPGVEGASTIDSSLIYPGAHQTMSINAEAGKSVLQLTSDDPAKKVADWYMAKLKVVKKVSIVGQTILKAGDITVIVMGSDEGSQILITRGDGEK